MTGHNIVLITGVKNILQSWKTVEVAIFSAFLINLFWTRALEGDNADTNYTLLKCIRATLNCMTNYP